MKRLTLALCLVTLAASVTPADEGMWTFDNVPKDLVAKKYPTAYRDKFKKFLELRKKDEK